MLSLRKVKDKTLTRKMKGVRTTGPLPGKGEGAVWPFPCLRSNRARLSVRRDQETSEN